MLTRTYYVFIFLLVLLFPLAAVSVLASPSPENSDLVYTQTNAEIGGSGLQFTVISRDDLNAEQPWVTIAVIVPQELEFSTLSTHDTFLVPQYGQRVLKIYLDEATRATFNVFSSQEKTGDVSAYVGWDFPGESLWTDPNFQQKLPSMKVDGVTVSFSTVNQLPTASTATISATTGTVSRTSLLSFVQDENPSALVFALTGCPAFVSLNGQELAVDARALSASNTYSCSYSVTDSAGQSASSSLIITVTHVNQAPRVDIQTLSVPGYDKKSIDISPHIVDDDSISTFISRFSCQQFPGLISFDGSTLNISAAGVREGSFDCTLVVSDGSLESAEDALILEVGKGNFPPTPNPTAPKLSLDPENLLLNLTVYNLAYDPEGDMLSFVPGSIQAVGDTALALIETQTTLTFSSPQPLSTHDEFWTAQITDGVETILLSFSIAVRECTNATVLNSCELCSNGYKLYNDQKTVLTGFLVPVRESSDSGNTIFPFPQLAQCRDFKEPAHSGSYARAARFYADNFDLKLMSYAGYMQDAATGNYEFNVLRYAQTLDSFGPLVGWDFLNYPRLKEYSSQNLSGGVIVLEDPFNLTWPWPPVGRGDPGWSGPASGGGGGGIPPSGSDWTPPPDEPIDPPPDVPQQIVIKDYVWSDDSCSYGPYILLEDKTVTIDKPYTAVFDLRGYVADMETPQCPQPPGAAIIGDGLDYAAGIFISGLGVIEDWVPDLNVDSASEYFALLNNPITNPEHKPRNNSGFYRNWDYTHAWEMSVEDEGTWSKDFSPEVSREQLLLWVRTAPGYRNGEYKIDVVDFWDLFWSALLGLPSGATISTGWQPVPEEWDLETVTNALAELDTAGIMIGRVSLSLRSTDGLSTKAYFDYLTFQDPDDYLITLIDQTNPAVAECYLSYDPLPYPPGTPIDFTAPGIYLHCDEDHKYQLGETNITLQIENKLGEIWQDEFTLTVEDTPPEIHSIDIISNTAQDITFDVVGWDDPDLGHGQNTLAAQGVVTYHVEVFVNGNLVSSYSSSDITQSVSTHAGIPAGAILPGSTVEIRITPFDGIKYGAPISTQFSVANTPPFVTTFESDSPAGEKQFGEAVSFTLEAIDAETQTLEYTFYAGDGGSYYDYALSDFVVDLADPGTFESGKIGSGGQLTLMHTYSNTGQVPYFDAVLLVRDGIDTAVASTLVELSYPPVVAPPAVPDPVMNLVAEKVYGTNDIQLTWDLPQAAQISISEIQIYSLGVIAEQTDLSANSPDFLASRLIATLLPTDTSYVYDASGDSEIYFKVATVNTVNNITSVTLTASTVGKQTVLLRERDGYSNWISLPLLEAHPDVFYAFASLSGPSLGYGVGHTQNSGLGICTGNANDDYTGVVKTATLFDFFEYQRQLAANANENAAVLAALSSYAPQLECQYVRNPPFDLGELRFMYGYDVAVSQDGVQLVVIGELIPDVSGQFPQTTQPLSNAVVHSARIGYSLPYEKNASLIFPDLDNGVELEYFDIDTYAQLRDQGVSEFDALSQSLLSSYFPPGHPQYLETLSPGKGYRVIATQDTTIDMRH